MSSVFKIDVKKAETLKPVKQATLAKKLATQLDTTPRGLLEVAREEIAEFKGKRGKRLSPKDNKKLESLKYELRVVTKLYRASVAARKA